MFLSSILLQNFRSYAKSEFTFSQGATVIIGPNTSGKSNLIESIFLLSTGKSFRTSKDTDMVLFGKQVGRASARILPILPISTPIKSGSNTTNTSSEETELEVVVSTGELEGKFPSKKFLVNKVPKRRVDFTGILPTVLFSPLDLELISGSPSHRREFLDTVLEQTDRDYRFALASYTKALRQRNALLEVVQNTGRRPEKQFEYWDNLLIQNGQMITNKREKFIEFLNAQKKDVFDFIIVYDASLISKERLLQYKDAEAGAGVTLVGPHRDDFLIRMNPESRDVRAFGSRGQQRLVVLQLKMLQLGFMKKSLEATPLLLLDDIFSELDEGHIMLVLEMVGLQQTIITTTHEEFIPKQIQKEMSVIELQ